MTHANSQPGEMHATAMPPAGVCGAFVHFWRTLVSLIGILACPGRRAEGETRLAALEREIACELMRRALIQMGRDPALAEQINPRFVLNGEDYDIAFDAPGAPTPVFTWLDYARALARHKYARALHCAFTRRGRHPRRLSMRLLAHSRRRLNSRRTRAFHARRRMAPVRADLCLQAGRPPPFDLIAS